MENNNKEYIFYLNWEDSIKNVRKVGYFAHIEDNFYLLISRKEDAETAYDNGFIGIPGFKAGEIYKGQELFDFFRNRILDKDSEDPCKELIDNKGESRVDSFSLEIVPEILADRQKQALLEAYEKQEELKKIRNKNEESIEINA